MSDSIARERAIEAFLRAAFAVADHAVPTISHGVLLYAFQGEEIPRLQEAARALTAQEEPTA